MKLTGKVTLKPRVVQIRCWHCQNTFTGEDPRYRPKLTKDCPYCGVVLILPTARPLDPHDVYITREGQEGVWEEQSVEDPAEAVLSDEAVPTPGIAYYAVPPEEWTAQDIMLLHRLLADEDDRLTEQKWQIKRLQEQVSRLLDAEEEEEEQE